MPGHFIISLDYELHWGVFDQKSLDSYRSHLDQVDIVVNRLVELSNLYNVKLTFATVGFLFAKDKSDLILHCPENRPSYQRPELNPYPIIDNIGQNEMDDPYHFALPTIRKIHEEGIHEISSHTFCHYYCHEDGQTPQQFESDLKAATAIAKSKDIKLSSIVFPRNMIEPHESNYLDICYKYGLKSYRGKEKNFIYNIHTTKFYHGWFLFKIIRILDAYFNITGSNIYDVKRNFNSGQPLNLPSSRLLRPFNKKLKHFEFLKLNRIKKGMSKAAKDEKMFHLWWHPHNFGSDLEENFKNLESIFQTYAKLNKFYGFESKTMSGLTKDIENMSRTNN